MGRVILPIIIIAISFWAGVVYGFYRDWLHMIYWLSASALNSAVLFMGDIG